VTGKSVTGSTATSWHRNTPRWQSHHLQLSSVHVLLYVKDPFYVSVGWWSHCLHLLIPAAEAVFL